MSSPHRRRACLESSAIGGRAPAIVLTIVAAFALTGAGTARAARAESAASSPIFREVAAEVGLDFVHFNGMIGKLYFAEVMGGGIAWIDFDGDGDLDVYAGQGAMLGDDRIEDATFPPEYPVPLTDRLYRNDLSVDAEGRRQLTFTDVTEELGLTARGYNMGVTVADWDNDGDADVYLTNLGSNEMLRNDGNGRFTDITEEAGTDDPSWSVAAAFLDFDRDGWLDLYVGNYTEFRHSLHKECTNATGAQEYCGPLSYGAVPNRLFRNRGDGTFENVTTTALLDRAAGAERKMASWVGSTLGVVTGDFDENGWPDVYVANDQRENEMWMNLGDGTLRDDALLGGAAVDGQGQPQASMGVVAGDFDGDGHDDLFMSHLTMEMNTLYINDGTGLFYDASSESGLGRPSWNHTGFGTALLDYDNDGKVDVYVANGAVKRIEEQLRAKDPHPLKEVNSLFRGLGEGRYEVVPTEQIDDGGHEEVSRGVAAGDVDNDGDIDLLVSNNAGPLRLLINQVGADRPWLGLRLMLEGGKRDAFGAKVALERADRPTQWRRVRTDGSYVSAHDPRVLFGLGDGEDADDPGQIERLVVRWPDGTFEAFSPDRLAVGKYTTLIQGNGKPVGDAG